MSTDIDNLLAGLNPEQRTAAMHGQEPLLIIAGAGSGKTNTLVHRVAYQIASGTPAERIMLLTYTRRAALQMIERLRRLVDDPAELAGIWAGTFHATSVRLLRIFGEAVGLSLRFTIHDRPDAEDLLDGLLRRILEKAKDKTFPKKGTALSIHSYQVNSQWPLKRVLEEQFPDYEHHEKLLGLLFKQYQAAKLKLGIVDYDDLLLLMRDLMQHPEVGPRIVERFTSVLVDEYQDTNTLQSAILQGLCPAGKGLTVVGDDAQSIYSFRAATVENILGFPEQFPGAKTVKLEQNYRSTQPLLEASNAVIAMAREGFEKQLWSSRHSGFKPQLVSCWSDHEEADMIVKRILRHRAEGVPLKDQAVLFRAAFHSLALETELARNKLPFVKYGGLKFAEAAHVKDILAYMRLAENQRDTVAALRILLLMPGIGPRKASQCVETLDVSTTGIEAWNQIKPPTASAQLWPQLVRLLTQLTQDKPAGLADQLLAILKLYQPLLEDRYDNAPQRLRDLEQLITMADRFESRQQMLVDLAIDPPSSTADLPHERAKAKEAPLVLSTIHSAKGLEWPVVYVMGATNGKMPMSRAASTTAGYEEERRLLYVALTRAARWLYVSYSESGASPGYNSWSRGWGQEGGGVTELLPAKICQLFQRQTAGRLKPLEEVTVRAARDPAPPPKGLDATATSTRRSSTPQD
jgi:DNA helicase II / ATP-dependent DNA helicase PcrA